MVGHQHLEDTLGEGAEALADLLDLRPRDAAVLERPGARGVHAHHREVLAVMERRQIGREVPAVVVHGPREPRQDIPQRHVVVAGDDDDHPREAVEEGAGGAELPLPRALREVAAHRDHGGCPHGELRQQGLRHRRILLAEVEVGDVGDGDQGTTTRSVRGRIR
jgi:hypothetical protein